MREKDEAVETRVRRPLFERYWRQRFERYAERHDDDARIAGWSSTGLQTRLRKFQRLWRGAAPGGLWADVGCGAGSYTRLLAGADLVTVGLDYSHGSVRKARERSRSDICWVVGDATKLPLATGSLEGVLCLGVMQSLERSEPAVAELVRAVKPGGQVWLDALNGWCFPHLVSRLARLLTRKPPHLRYDSPRDLRRRLRAAGVEGVKLYWLPILPLRIHGLQSLMEHGLVVRLLHICFPLGALVSHSFILYGERAAPDEA